jgi:plasmid stabilization system protein ParE
MPTDPGYSLSPLAQLDLEDIWTYTRKQWSRRQADSYTREMLIAFAELAQGQRIGTAAEDIRPGYRSRLASKHGHTGAPQSVAAYPLTRSTLSISGDVFSEAAILVI